MITLKTVMIDGNWRRIPMILTKTEKGWQERYPETQNMKEAGNG